MSSNSSKTETKYEKGFLQSDISKFLNQGNTLAGGKSTDKLAAPTKATRKVSERTVRKGNKFSFGSSRITKRGQPSFFETGFADVDQDQVTKLMNAFTSRRQQVNASKRAPDAFGRKQTLLS